MWFLICQKKYILPQFIYNLEILCWERQFYEEKYTRVLAKHGREKRKFLKQKASFVKTFINPTGRMKIYRLISLCAKCINSNDNLFVYDKEKKKEVK